MKYRKVAVTDDEYRNAYADEQASDIEIKIDGLEHLEGNRFLLKGISPRSIDWSTVESGMGELSDILKDKIAELVWKDDLVHILVERIK